MLERIIILLIVAAAGYIAWRLYNQYRLQRTTQLAPHDPVLASFRTGTPGILLFTADYCVPCKTQQQPAIRQLIDEHGADRIQVFQVDVQSDPDAAQRWGVMSLPTTIILDSAGQPGSVNHGVTPARKLRQQLEIVA